MIPSKLNEAENWEKIVDFSPAKAMKCPQCIVTHDSENFKNKVEFMKKTSTS